MRNYEVVFIVHPELDDTSFNEVIQKVNGWITEAGGIVSKVEPWGKRRMAYPIRKQKEGQYVMLQAQMAPAFGAELERNLRFQESVLRFLITSLE